MNNDKKVFAFKLADKKDKAATAKWKARDGISVAGCTDPSGEGDYREAYNMPGGVYVGRDGGYWC